MRHLVIPISTPKPSAPFYGRKHAAERHVVSARNRLIVRIVRSSESARATQTLSGTLEQRRQEGREGGMRDSIKSRVGNIFHPTPSFAMLALLSLAVAVPAIVIVRTLNPNFVLHAFGVLLFSLAAITVLLACSIKIEESPEDLTLWDVAGGLVMTGCAASALGEPEYVVQLFEHLFGTRSDSQ
jgi:hypothetical protein